MCVTYWILGLILVTFAAVDTTFGRLPYHDLSKEAIVREGHIEGKEDLFGYSVAYYSNEKNLIVGSPKESLPGNVYVCNVATSKCKGVVVSLEAANIGKEENHEHSWFGATVNAGSNFFMACGPRFVDSSETYFNQSEYKKRDFKGTIGLCYRAKASTSKMIKMSPIIQRDRILYDLSVSENLSQKERSKRGQEFCMDSLGWSSHVDGKRVLIGGPAMTTGRAIKYDKITSTPIMYDVTKANFNQNQRHKTINFGYSITSGKFFGSSMIYAISTPYGIMGKGRVLLYNDRQIFLDDSIQSENIGSLFGAALCSLSYRGEVGTKTALLVGAPAFGSKDTSAGSDSRSYDVGAVYLYTFTITQTKLHHTIHGFQIGGYFGHSIVSVGDHDGDSYDEVAIAAPYENEGRGAVYLYSGKQLLDKKVEWLQKFVPEGKASPVPRDQYFGLSLSALQDADDNGCNELAIGVPGDNKVVLYRCLASVKVDFDVQFPTLETQAQELEFKSSSFKFKPCLNVVYPVKPTSIRSVLDITVGLNHPNVTIQGADGGKITFNARLQERKQQYCEELTVNLPKDGDYDYKIIFDLKAVLQENPLERNKFDPQLVLINDGNAVTYTSNPVPLNGSILTFDIQTTLQDDYLIGSSEYEDITLLMHNGGATAIGACVRVRISGVAVSYAPSTYCSYSNKWLTCKPNPPLKKLQNWNTTVTLPTKQMTSLNEKLTIYAELLTKCELISGEPYNHTISLKRDKIILIAGSSLPSLDVKVTSAELYSAEGKHIEHKYAIINKGVTKWVKVEFEVRVPPHITQSVAVGYNNCPIKDNKAHCRIQELDFNVPTDITILMDILSDSPIITKIKNGNTSIVTNLDLFLGNKTRRESIKTIITLWEPPRVPLWIIIVAGIVALVILLLIGWILRECGCFRRKHKEELQELKKDIKRQTMRRTMMIRQSVLEGIANQLPKEDEQQLVDLTDVPDDSEHAGLPNDHAEGHPEDRSKERAKENPEDPARAALNAELAKAFGKDKTTQADRKNDPDLLKF